MKASEKIDPVDLVGTFSFIDTTLVVRSPLTLDGQFIFSGECIIDGLGNVVTCTSGTIIVDAGSILTLKNLTLKGISAGTIYCFDTTSTLFLDDVTWIQDGDYTFERGHVEFWNTTSCKGSKVFTYQSEQISIIHKDATWFFDSGMTFSYGTTSARNLISCEDSTSILHFYETDLYSVVPGLQFTKGTIIVEGECPVDNAATTTTDGIWFGDDGDSVSLRVLPESGFTVQSGYMVYKNV